MNQKSYTLYAVVLPLLLLTGCGREESDWNRAMQADTPASYADYVKQYPQGARAKLATARSAALVERNQWQLTIEKPTQSGLNAFLRDNPGSIWADEARAALDTLQDQQRNEPDPQSLDQQTGDHEAEPIPDAVQPAVKPVAESQPKLPPQQAPLPRMLAQVQLGAFKTRDAALNAVDAAKELSGGLRTSEPQIDIIKLKGQPLFRVRVGVASLQQAVNLCRELTHAGNSCLVVKQ